MGENPQARGASKPCAASTEFRAPKTHALQSCPTLRDPTHGSPPGSPVPGILQARTLERVAISLLQCMKVKSEREVAQSCPTVSDPTDCSLPGSYMEFSRQEDWSGVPLPSLFNKRSHRNKKPEHDYRVHPTRRAPHSPRASPCTATKTQSSQKEILFNYKK